MKRKVLLQRHQEGEEDEEAKCVLLRDEDHQAELDEVHHTLQSTLDPTHRPSVPLLHLLLEYLLDRDVRQPQSEPAGDDPCSVVILIQSESCCMWT